MVVIRRDVRGAAWIRLATVTSSRTGRLVRTYLDRRPHRSGGYVYGVRAVNTYGARSSVSEAAAISVST